MDGRASRRIADWDWVVTRSYKRLHAPLDWDDPHEDMQVEQGRTVCGVAGELFIPGVFSRLGTQRCRHCCRMTGMPQGTGSPKNDAACRPVVEERLKKLGVAEPA